MRVIFFLGVGGEITKKTGISALSTESVARKRQNQGGKTAFRAVDK
jgi:hypothetical protein